MPTPDDLRLYEAMFLVDTGDAAAWDDMTRHLEGILTRTGGEVIGITRWDERKLAYPVGKHKRGTYVLAFFAMQEGDGITEIEHACRLSEKVVRLLVLRADHFKVRDMRVQLGEDIREDIAARIIEMRGETEPEPEAEAPETEGEAAEAAPAQAETAAAGGETPAAE
jgi:small subunit ribosomal protein S6